MPETFESALQARVDSMLDACTRCGKCVEVCPVTGAAGVDAEPPQVIGGIIDLLRRGEGNAAARHWASGCVRSGDCIEACDYGVNPRFLLAMARAAMARSENDEASVRRRGIEGFRHLARDVNQLSRVLLDDALLARLGQGTKGAKPTAADTPPDFVFYTGCNVLKTPHIALLALDIMDALGVTYEVHGRPDPLLRHPAIAQRRPDDLRPLRRKHPR